MRPTTTSRCLPRTSTPGRRVASTPCALGHQPVAHVLVSFARRGAGPVILEAPEIGSVLVSEEDYASLYDQLSSTDPQQVELGVAALRAIKARETVEGAQDGAINMIPAPINMVTAAALPACHP